MTHAERLQRALREALDEMADMLPYVPDYFREKWDYDRTLARLREEAEKPVEPEAWTEHPS